MGKRIVLHKIDDAKSTDNTLISVCGRKMAYKNKITGGKWRNVKGVHYVFKMYDKLFLDMYFEANEKDSENVLCKDCIKGVGNDKKKVEQKRRSKSQKKEKK